jgi:hypothetical protein
MNKQIFGVLQLVRSLERSGRPFDLDRIAYLSNCDLREVVLCMSKLRRWGLVDAHGRVTERGHSVTRDLRRISHATERRLPRAA